MTLLGVLALAGCGPELVWRKPGATTADYNSAHYRCLRDSTAQAPVDQRVTSVSGDRTTRQQQARRRTSSSQSVSYTDVNRSARATVYDACMRAAGWRLEPLDSPGQRPAPTTRTAQTVAGDASLCRSGTRVFARSDDAWYAGRVLQPQTGGCLIRFDDSGAEDDEVVPAGALLAWAQAGPGAAVTACRRGERVIAFSEDGWYPATIKADGSGERCPVTYIDFGAEDDEVLPLRLIRRL